MFSSEGLFGFGDDLLYRFGLLAEGQCELVASISDPCLRLENLVTRQYVG